MTIITVCLVIGFVWGSWELTNGGDFGDLFSFVFWFFILGLFIHGICETYKYVANFF